MQPLSERDQMRLSQRFTVDFNYNSNHIEGNTLTYGQTELLLMFDQVVQTARMRDLEEMKASNVGLLMMKQEASVGDYPLTGTEPSSASCTRHCCARTMRSIALFQEVPTLLSPFMPDNTRHAPTPSLPVMEIASSMPRPKRPQR